MTPTAKRSSHRTIIKATPTVRRPSCTGSLRQVGIVGLGACLPQRVVTNAELERMVKTSDAWIRSRTGIRERRLIEPGQATSDLAAPAALEAIKAAGLRPDEIELIVTGTTTPDTLCPSASCVIQDKVGAKRAGCFDVNAACAGFVYALSAAQGLVASGQYQNALVIGADVLSTIIDWTDRSTCVLFGDGAGAAVIAPVGRGGILASYLGTDGSGACHLQVPAGGSRIPASKHSVEQKQHFLKMNGSEVFKFAVRVMGEAAIVVLDRAGLKPEDVDLFIPHQANIRIIQAAMERLHLPIEKVYLNVEKYGNMSAASTIVALYEAAKAGRIKRGDIVVLVAFGAGLVWGATVIEW
ncbi:MAG: ketoacyl-ACP synthase III [Candidatus Omnitrophica bacterium]|nr:ketoacyl-ACP synthase III [Candidatus Omnitrophota bacterium]